MYSMDSVFAKHNECVCLVNWKHYVIQNFHIILFINSVF